LSSPSLSWSFCLEFLQRGVQTQSHSVLLGFVGAFISPLIFSLFCCCCTCSFSSLFQLQKLF
jgi:hypothetical protein